MPTPPSASTSSTTHAAHTMGAHWMPDKLCKLCYSCEVQFTVFRRRHHCRLCGQVFCSSCSGYFVELGGRGGGGGDRPTAGEDDTKTADGSVTSQRACKMCYDQVIKSKSLDFKTRKKTFGGQQARLVEQKQKEVVERYAGGVDSAKSPSPVGGVAQKKTPSPWTPKTPTSTEIETSMNTTADTPKSMSEIQSNSTNLLRGEDGEEELQPQRVLSMKSPGSR